MCSRFLKPKVFRVLTHQDYMIGKRQNQINYWRRRKNRAMRLLGDKCIKCGFSDKRALQFDHIEGNGKTLNTLYGPGHAIKMVLEGSKSFQLLCANCNWIKRVENEENKIQPARMIINALRDKSINEVNTPETLSGGM